MADLAPYTWEITEGLRIVQEPDGTVSIIGRGASGDIECIDVPGSALAPLAAALTAADLRRGMAALTDSMKRAATALEGAFRRG